MNFNFKSLTPHLLALGLFFVLSFVYFFPQLEGKVLEMSDIQHFEGMSKEIVDYRNQTGKEALWTNNMFGGMPAYLISVKYKNNLFIHLEHIIYVLGRPASYLLVMLICFYVALLLFGLDNKISLLGSIAFSFTSYFFIIMAAGHTSKALAIAYLPPLIASIYFAYKRKMLLGVALTGFFMALEYKAGHPQITYYGLLIILILGIIEFINTIKEKTWKRFTLTTIALIGIVILAISTSCSQLWSVWEYGKFSMRGNPELTDNTGNQTSGLDKDYATAWSYGITETMTFLIPNAKGGSSSGSLGTNSKLYELLQQNNVPNAKKIIKQLPLYFGDQSFTSGGLYLGAITIFLFILSLFVIKGDLKWWLVSATILSILLAWGKNFMFLTDFFLEYFPGYNKFRTVSMILVIANFAIPVLAFIGLQKIISGDIDKKKFNNALKYSLYILGGGLLFLLVFPEVLGSFSPNLPQEQQLKTQFGDIFYGALLEDRKSIFKSDVIRSLVFILLSAGLVWAIFNKKIKYNYAITAFAFLLIIDLWPIAKRFLNADYFGNKREVNNPYTPSEADKYILQDKDPNFRVLNLAVSPFMDASTSYFHKSIGGYHGAKMRRYQDLIERHISQNNMKVWNMLNTKYIIVQQEGVGLIPQRNPGALGSVWFVEKYKIVANADKEIDALKDFEPASEAIIDRRFESFVKGKTFESDTTGSIVLEKYEPNNLIYKSSSKSEKLAVFSEIYYPKGWQAYIDNKAVDHFRVNYVLRSLVIPAGEHTIEFKFHPACYYVGEKIDLASSSLLLLFLIAVIFVELKKKKE